MSHAKAAETDSLAENVVLVIWNGSDHFTGTYLGMDGAYLPQTLEHRLKALRDDKMSKPPKMQKKKK